MSLGLDVSTVAEDTAIVTRKKWMLLLAGIIVAAWLCLVASTFWTPSEPTYEGETLSQWLTESSPETRVLAQSAIHQIGTNAIPILLKMLQVHDSALTVQIDSLAERVRLRLHVPASVKISEAEDGFEALGSEGKGAVPTLIQIIENSPSSESRYASIRILGTIGPDASAAVPTLLMAVTNANHPPSPMAMLVLGQIRAEPDAVVPVLLKFINSTNRAEQAFAFAGLRAFGPYATPAFSTMLVEATNPASAIRTYAIQVLGTIKAEPKTIVPTLTNLLGDKDPGIRLTAIEALGSFGTEAKSAVPLLVEALKDQNRYVTNSASQALKQIDPNTAR